MHFYSHSKVSLLLPCTVYNMDECLDEVLLVTNHLLELTTCTHSVSLHWEFVSTVNRRVVSSVSVRLSTQIRVYSTNETLV